MNDVLACFAFPGKLIMFKVKYIYEEKYENSEAMKNTFIASIG